MNNFSWSPFFFCYCNTYFYMCLSIKTMKPDLEYQKAILGKLLESYPTYESFFEWFKAQPETDRIKQYVASIVEREFDIPDRNGSFEPLLFEKAGNSRVALMSALSRCMPGACRPATFWPISKTCIKSVKDSVEIQNLIIQERNRNGNSSHEAR